VNQNDIPDAAIGVVAPGFWELLGMPDAMESCRQQKSDTQN
jgi:hypothetical protein